MDTFIQPSKQKVDIWKLQKNEIGSHRKRFLLLEKAANIIQAVFWRKLPNGADTKDAMRKILDRQNQAINSVDDHEDELREWLEKYEAGFINETGYIGEPGKPWGESHRIQEPKLWD